MENSIKVQNYLKELMVIVREQQNGTNVHRMANVLTILKGFYEEIRGKKVEKKENLLKLYDKLIRLHGELSKEFLMAISDGEIDNQECCTLHRISNCFMGILNQILQECCKDKHCNFNCALKLKILY